MARRAVVIATLAAASITGCGVGDDREQARSVVERFYAAVESGNGTLACGELSPDLIAQVESQTGQACDRGITRLSLDGGAVTSTQVYAVNAVVELGTGETAFLSRSSTGWRLSAIGCEPQPGKERDRPSECEAEA
jgi:hypothetical protein